MCRKVELLDKRMMLGVVVTQIVPQMMQFQQLHQHQIEVDSLSSGNLSSIQPALRHLIDFITVQHQVECESVMLVKKDVLVLNGQKLVQGMQVHKQLIQYRANGQWVLYSEHHGKGYTSSLTFRLQRSDGSEVEKMHTAWTQKGRKFLYHTLKRRGVLPLAEQGG